MADITIPPAALEAVAQAIRKKRHDRPSYEIAEDACLAMIEAWPGMSTDGEELHFSTARGAPVATVKSYSIILPVTENPNGKL